MPWPGRRATIRLASGQKSASCGVVVGMRPAETLYPLATFLGGRRASTGFGACKSRRSDARACRGSTNTANPFLSVALHEAAADGGVDGRLEGVADVGAGPAIAEMPRGGEDGVCAADPIAPDGGQLANRLPASSGTAACRVARYSRSMGRRGAAFPLAFIASCSAGTALSVSIILPGRPDRAAESRL